MPSFETKPNITLKYEWGDSKPGLDLDVLGDSIAGFDGVFKAMIKMLDIENDFAIKTRVAKDGSIVFEVLTTIASSANIIFHSIHAHIDFLVFIGKPIAEHGFELAGKAHRELNDFAARNPLDVMALG